MSNFWLFHFIFGFLGAVIWQVWHIATFKGEVKADENDTWSNHLGGLLSMTVFGYISFIMAVFMILMSVLDRWPVLWKPFFYVFIALLVGGCMTEVTKVRVGAICKDGTHSYATGRGACSWHGGVDLLPLNWTKVK